jgi:hypothetical protein
MKAPIKPSEPHLPIEPPKTYGKLNNIYIAWNEVLTLADLLKKLPKGISPAELRFEHQSCDHGYNSESYTHIYYMTIEPTPQYKSLMIAYRKQMKAYQKAWAKYRVAYKTYVEAKNVYDAWAEEQELKNLEKRLADLKKKKAKS